MGKEKAGGRWKSQKVQFQFEMLYSEIGLPFMVLFFSQIWTKKA